MILDFLFGKIKIETLDFGNSIRAMYLYEKYPDVELPHFETVGPMRWGVMDQWISLGIKFWYKGKLLGMYSLCSREYQIGTPKGMMGLYFREVLDRERMAA